MVAGRTLVFTVKRLLPLALVIPLAVSTALAADEGGRFIRKAQMPGTPTMIVVAEGELEPRSIGSYSIRAYAEADPRSPFDHFVAGVVRPRDGAVEDVRFSDLDRDGSTDIIVVIRSVGTGGYVSADAFQLRGAALHLLASVADLPKDADPVQALQAMLANPAGPRASQNAGKPRR